MKKSVKITLITVAAVLGAILLTFVGCAIYASTGRDTRQPTAFLSEWMKYIDDDTLLKDVVIPGSHDAGTKGMPYVAETQDRSVGESVKEGVRYFDLRVRKDGDVYSIFHSIIKGGDFKTVLKDLTEFITAHPTETLILDFQHFGGDSQNDVAELVKNSFQGKLVVNDTDKTDVDFIDSLSLKETRGKCVIFWGSEDDNLAKNYIFLRNGDEGTRANSALHSFYISSYNKKDSAKYVEEGLPAYFELRDENLKGLFVLQGQLTDGLFVFGPKFRERSHLDNMNNYVAELKNNARLASVNIIMRDYTDCVKNSLAINLNIAKNNVVESNVNFFRTELEKFIKA